MADGKFLVGKPSGGVTTITVADGASNTSLVLPESGTVATTASVKAEISNGSNLVTSPTGVIGYGIGAGGSVTQLTSKITTVTLNKPTGKITTSNSALAAGATAVFTVTNSFFDGSKDIFNITGTTFSYNYVIRVYYAGFGSVQIEIKNNTAGSLSESIDINFAIIKGAN